MSQPTKATASASKKRWRPRFSLRALFVLLTLFCLWLGWRASVVNRIERAIGAIEQAGGEVEYPAEIIMFTNPGGPVVEKVRRRSYAEKLLLGYRDKDLPNCIYFGDLMFAYQGPEEQRRDDFDDVALARIAPAVNRLGSIREIYLGGTRVTGAGCRTLAGMPSLRLVSLDCAPLTDANLENLAMLKQLKALSLDETPLSVDTIDELAELLPGCRIEHDPPLLSDWDTAP